MEKAKQETIRRYADRIAANLAENSGLRDELDDAQAERLLTWGSARAQIAAASMAHLDEVAARAAIEDATGAIARVMRQVNGLTHSLAYLVEDDLTEEILEGFRGTVREVNGKVLDDDWMDDMIGRRLTMDAGATFDFLMESIALDPDRQIPNE